MTEPKLKRPIGGIKAAADMVKNLDGPTRERILAGVAAKDPRVAEEIRKNMFVFEDLLVLPDREMQVFLREIPHAMLATALRTASEEFKAAVFRGFSARARQMLREEMEAQGRRRRSEVEAAQAEIIAIARRLEGEGKILLQRPELK
ncbi:MAG: hypothetical protein HYW49_04650 [Deltaproteobacteria bacterium]|nr:hypothetical protein [Deltaproteobacteria bacterium]